MYIDRDLLRGDLTLKNRKKFDIEPEIATCKANIKREEGGR